MDILTRTSIKLVGMSVVLFFCFALISAATVIDASNLDAGNQGVTPNFTITVNFTGGYVVEELIQGEYFIIYRDSVQGTRMNFRTVSSGDEIAIVTFNSLELTICDSLEVAQTRQLEGANYIAYWVDNTREQVNLRVFGITGPLAIEAFLMS